MTISRSTPIHGTGHTVGEVIDAATTGFTNHALIIHRNPGQSMARAYLGSVLDASTDRAVFGYGASISTEASSDAWFSAPTLTTSTSSPNGLVVYFWGFSTDTPTDWTINVQLTPIAP